VRGAALADLHLGFRQFTHVSKGRNTREIDTEEAWFAAVKLIVENKPDLVTIAGDVFHHPRASNFATRAFLTGVRNLIDDTDAEIVIAQGNHDAGRTAEVLTPIALAEGWNERVHVVTTPKRIRFKADVETVSVAVFPFVVMGDGKSYKLDPDPEADVNVLLLHAAVRGSSEGDRLPYFYGSADQALDVGREVDRWDVIACGDYHEFTRLDPTNLAFYSGSLERTSSNIWDEHHPKGVVFYDTATGEMELAPVPNRKMSDYDLGDFDHPPGVGADKVNECLEMLGSYITLEDTIVRFKVDAFPRAEREHINWALVRALKSYCTHFYLDIRYGKAEALDLGDRRNKKTLSLADEWLAFSKDDPDDVRACAVHFLDLEAEVEDAEVET